MDQRKRGVGENARFLASGVPWQVIPGPRSSHSTHCWGCSNKPSRKSCSLWLVYVFLLTGTNGALFFWHEAKHVKGIWSVLTKVENLQHGNTRVVDLWWRVLPSAHLKFHFKEMICWIERWSDKLAVSEKLQAEKQVKETQDFPSKIFLIWPEEAVKLSGQLSGQLSGFF